MVVDPQDFTPEALRAIAPACAECASAERVELVRGEAIYPNRPDLWKHGAEDKWWWLCGCGAYVGIHRGTLKPLGSPAGKATWDARSQAHAAFDPLWQRKMRKEGCKQHVARNKGYKWLADKLGIDRKDCHIGMMSAATALRVVEICRNLGRKG